MKTNRYKTSHKEALVSLVLADNRKQAAELMRCPLDSVEFEGQTKASELQRAGRHARKVAYNCWSKAVFPCR